MKRTNPTSLHKPVGYTHIVEATPNRTIYISGQVAFDRDGTLVGPGDLRAQTMQVFENLRAALESAGATFDDLAKITVFMLDASQIQVYREVRGRYLSNLPASTLVEVARLARPEWLIEIEAVALLEPDTASVHQLR